MSAADGPATKKQKTVSSSAASDVGACQNVQLSGTKFDPNGTIKLNSISYDTKGCLGKVTTPVEVSLLGLQLALRAEGGQPLLNAIEQSSDTLWLPSLAYVECLEAVVTAYLQDFDTRYADDARCPTAEQDKKERAETKMTWVKMGQEPSWHLFEVCLPFIAWAGLSRSRQQFEDAMTSCAQIVPHLLPGSGARNFVCITPDNDQFASLCDTLKSGGKNVAPALSQDAKAAIRKLPDFFFRRGSLGYRAEDRDSVLIYDDYGFKEVWFYTLAEFLETMWRSWLVLWRTAKTFNFPELGSVCKVVAQQLRTGWKPYLCRGELSREDLVDCLVGE